MNSRAISLTGILLGSTVLLSSCGKNPPSTQEMTPVFQHASYALTLERPSTIKVGKKTDLLLDLKKDGKEWNTADDYRMMHVILASKDFQDVVHSVQPQQTEKGKYLFSHTFTSMGPYRLWVEIDDVQADLHHGKDADLLATAALTVDGKSQPGAIPLTTGNSVTQEGHTLTLMTPKFVAGADNDLRLSVHDSKGSVVALAPQDAIVFAATDRSLSFIDHGHLQTASDGLSAGIPLHLSHPGEYVVLVQATFFSETDRDFHTIESHFLIQAQ